ncbi:MAG: glycosyltransferase [Christensenellales bacterium]
MDKKKILITFIESGFGHITSAKAISDSLKEKFCDKYEIIDCNIMKESEKTVAFEKFLTNQTKATNKIHGYGFFIFTLLEAFGGEKFLKFTHNTIFHSYVEATVQAFAKYKPDCIVSTHYFLTFCAVEYKRKVDKNCLIVTYNPDNNVHPWWDNRDGIFITNNIYATKEAIEKRKFKSENCKTVNFACRAELLECNNSKEFYREKYGINKDDFCVIVADGGYALGKCKAVTNELLKTDKKMTIIAIAGKNEKVYNYFLNKKPKDNITFIPLSFINNIYELYKAADLFITKAGPNAVLDCIFMNTPVLIDYYPHPIEKATKELFVDKYKCGEYIKSPKKIRKRVEELADNPQILQEYVKNTYNFKKECNGANEIADIIDDALNNKDRDEK